MGSYILEGCNVCSYLFVFACGKSVCAPTGWPYCRWRQRDPVGVVCLYEWYRNITLWYNLDFTITDNNPFSTAGVARGLTAAPVQCPEVQADEQISPGEPAV